jgi:hypothetical protein
MKDKKVIFIGVIALVICIVLLATILLLSLLSGMNNTNNTNPPVSTPVSLPVNIIDLTNAPGGRFEYAVIRPDDTIELKNKMNERFIIGLEKREWKSLSWSPDGKLVAALGKSAEDIYDIYIYNIESKTWSTATDYRNFEDGVDQYVWTDNNTILYTQGQAPNRWLHRFNYLSKEILKASNILGNIVSVSPNRNFVVIKDTVSAPEVYDSNGVKLTTVANIRDLETQSPIAFSQVEFFKDSDKILAKTLTDSYYKMNLGDTNAVVTTLPSTYQTLCSLSDNSFGVFDIDGNTLTYATFNSRDDLLNILVEEEFKKPFSINKELSYCINSTAYIKVEFTDLTTKWYKLTNTTLEEDLVLVDNIETAIIK